MFSVQNSPSMFIAHAAHPHRENIVRWAPCGVVELMEYVSAKTFGYEFESPYQYFLSQAYRTRLV